MDGFVELRHIWATLRQHWWLLLCGALLGGSLGYAISLTQTPVYEATTSLAVGSITDENLQRADIQLSELLVLTYADLIRRKPVMQGTVDALQLPDTWQTLRNRTRVRAVENTQLLEINVRAGSAVAAQQTANEIAQQLIELNLTSPQAETTAETEQFVAQRLKNLQNSIETAQSQLDALAAQAAAQGSTSSQPNAKTKAQELEELIANWEGTYARLLASASLERTANQLTVIEQAEMTATPVTPRTELNTLLAALVGFSLAAGLAFLRSYWDDRLRTPEDIAQSLGLNTLGAISKIKGKNNKYKLLSPQDTFLPASEAYRLFRSQLQFLWTEWPRKVILLTSPAPGLINSQTVANLGIVLAQAGLRTVIVDANLREPQQHLIFQTPNRQGITELLQSPQLAVRNLLQKTTTENLRVLTAGAQTPAYPSEMLGSRQMRQLLDTLAELTDVVLCDSAQAVSLADTLMLARQVDGVVLVIEAGKAQRTVAQQAVHNLQQANANLLGVVLNPVTTTGLTVPDFALQAVTTSNAKNVNLSNKAGLAPMNSLTSFNSN